MQDHAAGESYVSLIHADPIKGRLIVAITGGEEASQQAVAKQVKSAVTSKVKFAHLTGEDLGL